LLPMSSGENIPPGTSARIASCPQNYSIRPDRLLIKHAEHWHINRAETMRFPWLPAGPANAFAPGEHTPLPERRIPCAGSVTLAVTYVGPLKGGEPFEACLFVTPCAPPFVPPAVSSAISPNAWPHIIPPRNLFVDCPEPTGEKTANVQREARIGADKVKQLV